MQRYTVFFITVNALHVSGSFSTHHHELKNCAHSIQYMSCLHAATASGKTATFWTDWVLMWLVKCIKRWITIQPIYP